MSTLQELLSRFDESSAVHLWAITPTKHEYYLTSPESKQFVETELLRLQQTELLKCIQTEIPKLISAASVTLSLTRPSLHTMANLIFNAVQDNIYGVFRDLDDISEAMIMTPRGNQGDIFQQAKDILLPLRHRTKAIAQKWDLLKSKVYDNIEELGKGLTIDVDGRFEEITKDMDAPSRLVDLKLYLREVQSHVKQAATDGNALKDICNAFNSIVADWHTIDALCLSLLEQYYSKSNRFPEKVKELQSVFEKLSRYVPPEPKILVVPMALKAPANDPGCGSLSLTQRWSHPFRWNEGFRRRTLEVVVPFSFPQPSIPKVLLSLEGIRFHVTGSSPFRLALDAVVGHVTTEGMMVSISTEKEASGDFLQDASIRYLLIQRDDPRFKNGTKSFVVSSGVEPRNQALRKSITFEGAKFATTPKILCWLTGIDVETNSRNENKLTIGVCAKDVSTEGFTIELETFISPETKFLSVGWVAFPRSVESGNDDVVGAAWRKSDTTAVEANKPLQESVGGFRKFCGISSFATDIGCPTVEIWPNGAIGGLPDNKVPNKSLDIGISVLRIAGGGVSAASTKKLNSNADPSVALAALNEQYLEESFEAARVQKQRGAEIFRLNAEVERLTAELKTAKDACDVTQQSWKKDKEAHERAQKELKEAMDRAVKAERDSYVALSSTAARDKEAHERVQNELRTQLNQVEKNRDYYQAKARFPDSIASAWVRDRMNDGERGFVNDWASRVRFRNFRYDAAYGNRGGAGFNNIDWIELSHNVENWPNRLTVCLSKWYDVTVVGRIEVAYGGGLLVNGAQREVQTLDIWLHDGEKINKVKMTFGNEHFTVRGILYMEFITNEGRSFSIGSRSGGIEDLELTPYDETIGLKGFWGNAGCVIDRLGIIWGYGP